MLRVGRTAGALRALAQAGPRLTTSARASISQPNAPLDLDPSLQALLRDVDVSLMRHKTRVSSGLDDPMTRKHRELEVYEDVDEASLVPRTTHDELEYDDDSAGSRKSPAAAFGSRQIGAVVLPLELQNAITRLIEGLSALGSDKGLLRLDAKRLFAEGQSEERNDGWDADFDVRYKSRLASARHAERDGTAFASVALPSHFAAIYSVFDQLVHRLGPSWRVERVFDFNAGTGSGMWAALSAFQAVPQVPGHGPDLSQSSLVTYLGIDNRVGLVQMGKRLMEGVDLGRLSTSWQRSFREEDKIKRTEGADVLALSAFGLSGLPTPLARKQLVKEMWESGADVIVLIDHNDLAGFDNIAEARQQLLRMGQKEMNDPETAHWPVRGAHAVAPCPHDGACPLHHPGTERLVCGFSQRLQRPGFLRRTKHSGVGHEDIGYSYVVIRRGSRPTHSSSHASRLGRLGQVGHRALQRELEKLEQATLPRVAEELKSEVDDGADIQATAGDVVSDADTNPQTHVAEDVPVLARMGARSEDEVIASLREEAFRWPRLVFPPLKRSGHIILDVCSPQGKILRMTIPKSQGKQPYYDARKSAWGDIFPHEPKNTPQERYVPPDGRGPVRGSDIGKRGVDVRNATDSGKDSASYRRLAEELKRKKTDLRRARRQPQLNDD